jgi:N-acetylglucosaminyldiphosphoundecaprenol N-acetyl-beta-D-mannosaminyltransferase
VTTAQILGVPVHAVTRQSVVAACEHAVDSGTPLNISVVNAAKLVHMRHDEHLRRAVLAADLILADGQSVVWAGRLLRQPLPERVTGIDLFLDLLDRAERRRYTVYFLGARPQVLETMLARLRERYPRLRVCGHRDGYFPVEESAAVAEQIRAADPDLLFVGISSPRKEIFLDTWGGYVGARVCHGVGGSFEVVAGLTRRAPAAWQRLGLEWLYRVKQEPRRLWKRYLTTNTVFLVLLARDLVSRRMHGPAS